jgi:hypothetical protein
MQDEFKFDAEGMLPLYSKNEFESGLKAWLKKEIGNREKDFKIAL